MLTEKTGDERIIRAAVLIAIGFAIVLLRLWQLQVLQGEEFRRISETNRLRIIGVPAPRGIIFDRNRIPLVKNSPYFCASVIPQEFDRRLIPALADLLQMSADELLTRITKRAPSPFTPVRLKEGLSFPEVSRIEARRSDFPGLLIDIEVSRDYIYGSVGSHLIGYLGKPTPGQLKDPEFRDVPPEAFIGQWGVEKLFDKTLRGTAGQRIIEVDAVGREIRLIRETPPVKGSDLMLSIDLALQKEAEASFEGKAGALVALKPGTGEILGLVSAPSFDPNRFSTGINPADWNELMTDKKLPMLNRAVQSQYPPGSTFKVVVSIAALEEKAIDTSTRFSCSGGLGYGKWHFGCWKKGGHGGVMLHRGIVESCDVFFYETGKRLGFDKVHDYALALGLGNMTGIPIGTEKKGLIPNEEWKREVKKEPWMLGETFINSIGQGYVSTTPLQMAVMINAVANGGSVYKPAILKDEQPKLIRQASISDSTLAAVRNGLRGVVNEPGGTAQSSRSAKTVIAGKTGTAQVVGIRKDSKLLAEKFRDHAWFVAYAPFEKPEVALSVFVEHGGHGGSAAAPIAKKAIEAYLLSDKEKKELLHVQD